MEDSGLNFNQDINSSMSKNQQVFATSSPSIFVDSSRKSESDAKSIGMASEKMGMKSCVTIKETRWRVSDSGLPMTRGLQNLGNTCYMNSLLQVLINTPGVHYQLHENRHECGSPCLTCDLRQVSEMARRGGAAPRSLVSHLPMVSKTFKPFRQQDPHELFLLLLGKVDAGVKSLFEGKLNSTVTCSRNHASSTVEPFFNLSLDISSSSSLQGALTQFFAPDSNIPGYNCVQCHKKVSISKKYSLDSLPSVLSIQLNRFNAFAQKINKNINFDDLLKVNGQDFELYGIVEHLGGSINSGHYIAYVKAPNGSWYKADDSFVSTSRVDQIKNVRPYLLFYLLKSKEKKIEKSQPILAQTPIQPTSIADIFKQVKTNTQIEIQSEATPVRKSSIISIESVSVRLPEIRIEVVKPKLVFARSLLSKTNSVFNRRLKKMKLYSQCWNIIEGTASPPTTISHEEEQKLKISQFLPLKNLDSEKIKKKKNRKRKNKYRPTPI